MMIFDSREEPRLKLTKSEKRERKIIKEREARDEFARLYNRLKALLGLPEFYTKRDVLEAALGFIRRHESPDSSELSDLPSEPKSKSKRAFGEDRLTKKWLGERSRRATMKDLYNDLKGELSLRSSFTQGQVLVETVELIRSYLQLPRLLQSTEEKLTVEITIQDSVEHVASFEYLRLVPAPMLAL